MLSEMKIVFYFLTLAALFSVAGCSFENGVDSSSVAPSPNLAAPGKEEPPMAHPVEQDLVATPENTQAADVTAGERILFSHADEHGSIIAASSEIAAIAPPGYHFVGWSDGSVANPRSGGNGQGNVTVTARFASNEYVLTYSAQSNGSILGDMSQRVKHGESGSAVRAVPSVGYHFVAWSDGMTADSRTDQEIIADRLLTARFAINSYTLTYAVQGNGSVAGDSPQKVNHGENGRGVTAVAAQGYHFVTWSDGVTSTQRVDRDITEDMTVSAVFAINTHTIGGSVSGLLEGDELRLRINGGDDLLIAGNGDFSFTQALDDGSTYEVTIHQAKLRPNWACKVEKEVGQLAGGNVTDIRVVCLPELILQSSPGRNRVALNWNGDDFSGAVFDLCRASEEIAETGFNDCARLRGGTVRAKVSNPVAEANLVNDNPYWFQLQARHGDGRRSYSKPVRAIPIGGLNDTGIDWCAGGNVVLTGATRAEKIDSCDNATAHPAQDANYGRDAEARVHALGKIGAGAAGFDFTKVCMSGEGAGEGSCPPNPRLGNGPNNWACTRDNMTGLLWEVKTSNGLRSQNNTYSWYDPEVAKNGGNPGLQNGGECDGGGCDTHAFVLAVNILGLCGSHDWRLPSRSELLSIVDNGRIDPAIDTDYFPNTVSSRFWTGSPYAENTGSAWHLYLRYGEVYTSNKNQSNHLRLVRGRTATFARDNPLGAERLYP